MADTITIPREIYATVCNILQRDADNGMAARAELLEDLRSKATAAPSEDAALTDAIKRACQYYRQAGRVGATSQMLAKQHEHTADKIIESALRARAVPDCDDDLWSFLRNVLQQGAAIAADHAEKHYELYSARLDAAARERESQLVAMLAASKEST